jgi:uncharacterized membrane protein YccC
MAANTQALTGATFFNWPFLKAFADLRVRYGIKLGLAGVISLYMTQILRLEHANWAILSALVMMNSHYVGATAIKAILRVEGTIIGAVIAVWLIGTYATTPSVLLPIMFLIIAFVTYKFGQFPAAQTPYAYFLIGNSLVAIATYAIPDPSLAWSVAINRSLETLVGAGVSLVVGAVVWPRYAREEFFTAARTALSTLSRLFSGEAAAYLRQVKPPEELDQVRTTFIQNIQAVRFLFQTGARESIYFRARLGNYSDVVTSLSNVFQSAMDLQNRTSEEVLLLDQAQTEVEAFFSAVSEEFEILAQPRRPGQPIPDGRLNLVFQELESKVHRLRDTGVFYTVPLAAGISFGGFFATMRQVRDDLLKIREALGDVPRHGQPPPKKKVWHFKPQIDWFWVKAGIKGGLSVVIAFALLKWIHPPGSTALPLSTWLFSFMGRNFLRSGGPGDQRVFIRVMLVGVLLSISLVFLIFLTPFLADFATMNVTLFVLLFLYAFSTARVQGQTFWMTFVIIMFSVFVGLNPQQPVATTAIIDSLLGTWTGIIIASVVGRLLWPVLPQRLLRDDLLAFISALKSLLAGDQGAERARGQLVVLPVEAFRSAREIRIPGFRRRATAMERENLLLLIRAFQSLAAHVVWLVRQRENLPAKIESIVRPHLRVLEVEYAQFLEQFAECFHSGDARRNFPTLDGADEALLNAVGEIRDARLLTQEEFEIALQLLQVVHRYLLTSERFRGCAQRIGAVKIHQYWGDWIL